MATTAIRNTEAVIPARENRGESKFRSIYHAIAQDEMIIETGVPTELSLPGEARIASGWLQEGRMATTTHIGPYDRLTEAYEALYTWIQAHGEESAGSPWESYANDAGSVSAAALRTIVTWPIK